MPRDVDDTPTRRLVASTWSWEETVRLLHLVENLEARIKTLEGIAKATAEAVASASVLLDTLAESVKRHTAAATFDKMAPLRTGRPAEHVLCDCPRCRKQRADELAARRDDGA